MTLKMTPNTSPVWMLANFLLLSLFLVLASVTWSLHSRITALERIAVDSGQLKLNVQDVWDSFSVVHQQYNGEDSLFQTKLEENTEKLLYYKIFSSLIQKLKGKNLPRRLKGLLNHERPRVRAKAGILGDLSLANKANVFGYGKLETSVSRQRSTKQEEMRNIPIRKGQKNPPKNFQTASTRLNGNNSTSGLDTKKSEDGGKNGISKTETVKKRRITNQGLSVGRSVLGHERAGIENNVKQHDVGLRYQLSKGLPHFPGRKDNSITAFTKDAVNRKTGFSVALPPVLGYGGNVNAEVSDKMLSYEDHDVMKDGTRAVSFTDTNNGRLPKAVRPPLDGSDLRVSPSRTKRSTQGYKEDVCGLTEQMKRSYCTRSVEALKLCGEPLENFRFVELNKSIDSCG